MLNFTNKVQAKMNISLITFTTLIAYLLFDLSFITSLAIATSSTLLCYIIPLLIESDS